MLLLLLLHMWMWKVLLDLQKENRLTDCVEEDIKGYLYNNGTEIIQMEDTGIPTWP